MVPPVVEKVLGNKAYEVLATVPYLQVEFSLVARDVVVWVVPAAKVPEGEALERVGGVLSDGGVPEVYSMWSLGALADEAS